MTESAVGAVISSTIELESPTRELPAEGRRLCVNPVRAADADRVAMLFCAGDDGRQRPVETSQDQFPCVLHLKRERRVHDIG